MEPDFNFNLTVAPVFRSYKIWSFPLCRYSKWLSRIFLALFAVSLLSFFASLLAGTWPSQAVTFLGFFLAWYLVFFEVSVFMDVKMKNPKPDLLLSVALANPAAYNLAEFLSTDACGIMESAIKKSKLKKLSEVASELLLYFTLLQSKDVQALVARLGLDSKKLLQELKNHFEKQQGGNSTGASFSQTFKDAVKEAANVAVERGQNSIGEKELLVGLVRHDAFFKKVLVDHDLKEKDIENLTLWLSAMEGAIKKSRQFWSRENLAAAGSLGRDFASGFTVTLDKFSIDWREVVRKNRLGQIVGHAKEADELEMVLVKSQLGNALLVGEEGVGRKSIVEALAQRCYLATGLAELAGKRVVELSMVALCSQIDSPEKLESTLDQIFKEALAAGNVILVIDQLDQFVLQRGLRPGSVDISVILGKYLAMPQFHFIGITSFDALHRNLEQNASFLEYFRKIEVSEVSETETMLILQNVALGLEKKYHVIVTYPAIRETINLTARYLPSTPFPKKAIDVLEEAMVYVSTLKDSSLGYHAIKTVLPSHIARIISNKTQIPVGKMEFKEKSVLLDLEHLIHQRIIGQDEAVKEISIALRRSRSGLGSKKRPMGVFLFLGPTGVGKTETAKALAQIYFKGEDNMIRLDMSEFQAIADIPRLLGQVSPVEEQGLLTTPVRENPFSLVLLDEIEKAHPNILNLFLQVFDEGHITDGQGRKVIFTNTIIICTSNAGADVIFEKVQSGQKIQKDQVFAALFQKGIFKPEFINRFDAAVFFNSLTREDLLHIAELNLQGLAKNLKEKDIDFTITEALKEKIVQLSYKPEFGAREMRRVIQDNVENAVAQALLSDNIVKGDTIQVSPEDFQIIKDVK